MGIIGAFTQTEEGIWALIIIGILTFIIIFIIQWQKRCFIEKYEKDFTVFLEEQNFKLSQRVTVIPQGLEFIVDNDNKNFAMVSFKTGEDISKKIFFINLFNFDNVIDFDLVEDYDMELQGRAGASTVGALLFGSAGAVIGSSGTKKISKTNRTVIINIHLNKTDTPLITICFSDMPYQLAITNAHTIKSILLNIKQNNADNKVIKVDTVEKEQEDNDIVIKIKKLNELKEQGLITEEEYNKKKQDLLNNL